MANKLRVSNDSNILNDRYVTWRKSIDCTGLHITITDSSGTQIAKALLPAEKIYNYAIRNNKL